MNLGVSLPLQFFVIVWEGYVLTLFYMFGRIPLWSHPVLDFCFLGVFWLLIPLLFFGHATQHMGFSSLTRDWTHAPCNISTEPKPLDCQGIPTESIAILVTSLFRLSISSWLSLGKLYVSRILFISSRLSSLLAFNCS